MMSISQVEEAYLALLTLNANECVSLGADVRLDELPEVGEASRAKENAQIARLLDLIAQCEPQNAEQALDLNLMAAATRHREFHLNLEVNGLLNSKQMPVAGDDISSGIFLLVTQDPRPAAQRLANIQSRLEQVPNYLIAAFDFLDTPLKRWVDIERDTLSGLAEFFDSIVAWAEQEEYAQQDALRKAVSEANRAIAQYSDKLVTLPVTSTFALGEEKTLALLRAQGVDLSLATLHQIAIDFQRDTSKEIASLRARLAIKYALDSNISVQNLQAFLHQRFAVEPGEKGLEGVIDIYKATAQKVREFIDAKALFPIPDEQDMHIMRTPNFMAPMIPAGAMMQPAALRERVKVSQVYLTLSEALLDEHNTLGIPIMMVHEGIPGHHLQLATACMHSSLVRRTYPAMEHAEGWTIMLEDYMLDQGLLGDLEDEARFIAKLDISRISARLAIDLYFMSGDRQYLDLGLGLSFEDSDPFVNAGKLLKAVTGFTDARVEAELNWYSQERGYPLCYLLGRHQVMALKQAFKQKQQGSLSDIEQDRLFHQTYLSSGNMPLKYLYQVFERKGLI